MATGEGYYELKINKWPTQLRVLQRSEVPELIAEGLALTPLVLATPERIAALDQALTMAQWYCEEYHDHANGCPDMSPLYAMLAEMKGEAHDADE